MKREKSSSPESPRVEKKGKDRVKKREESGSESSESEEERPKKAARKRTPEKKDSEDSDENDEDEPVDTEQKRAKVNKFVLTHPLWEVLCNLCKFFQLTVNRGAGGGKTHSPERVTVIYLD